MSTLASSISTIMQNVQNAANFILRVVDAEANRALDLSVIKTYTPPEQPEMLEFEEEELTDLYTAIGDSITRMKDLLKELPAMPDLLADMDKQLQTGDAFKPYESAVKPYVDAVYTLMTSLPTYTAPDILGASNSVKVGITELSTSVLTEASLPSFARAAFTKQMGYRTGLIRDQIGSAVAMEDSQTTAKTNAEFDELALKKKQALVDKTLEAKRGVMQAQVQKVLTKVVLTPDQLLDFWEKSAMTRSDISTKAPMEFAAGKLDMQMTYAKKVIGEYYRVSKDLADFSIELFALQERVFSEDRLIQARIQQGLASAYSDISSAAYSAVRTNFVLSEKAFA